MSLEQQLAAQRKESKENIPEETREVMERAVKDLAESGILDRALKKGAEAPDFTLPDVDGAAVSLSGLLAKGPAIVTFYRGGW